MAMRPIATRSGAVQKALAGRGTYVEASTRIYEGSGHYGAKPWPFDYHRAVHHCQGWVYRCAMGNAQAAAAVPLRLYVRKRTGAQLKAAGLGAPAFESRRVSARRKRWLLGEHHDHRPSAAVRHKLAEFGDDFEEITDHPALALLRTVNPMMNGFDLATFRFTSQQLTGNAYIHPVMSGALHRPAELWPMMANWTRIVPTERGDDETVVSYVYGADYTREHRFEVDEVLHFARDRYVRDPHYGFGPLEAAWSTIGLSYSKRISDKALFDNMARPDYVLSIEGANPEQAERAEARVNALRRGVRNVGKALVTSGKARVQTLQFPPKDIGDFPEIVEEVAGVFGYPIQKLRAAYEPKANAEIADYGWMKDTILPMLRHDEETLNQGGYLRLFGDGALLDDAVLAYDDPVPANAEARRLDSQVYVAGGVWTINDDREDQGLPPVEGGDEPRVNGVSLSALDAQAEAQAEAARQPFGGFMLPQAEPRDEPEQDEPTPAQQPSEGGADNVVEGEKLNGAQITAAADIVSQVTAGQMPRVVAIELLVAVGMSNERAERMVDEAIVFKPRETPAETSAKRRARTTRIAKSLAYPLVRTKAVAVPREDHPALTAALTDTYDDADDALPWIGWMEPADASWIGFLAEDGWLVVFDERDDDGEVMGKPWAVMRDDLLDYKATLLTLQQAQTGEWPASQGQYVGGVVADKAHRPTAHTRAESLTKRIRERHTASAVMLMVTGDAADQAFHFNNYDLDPADIAPEGVEVEPHVTVKWGLTTDRFEDLADILRAVGPIHVRFGKVALFESDKHDVVYVEVDSGDALPELHAELSELPHNEPERPYTPHMTLAYVKPGMGKKYAGSDAFDGMEAILHTVVFSASNGDSSVVTLRRGKQEQQRDDEGFEPATEDEKHRRKDASQVADRRDDAGGEHARGCGCGACSDSISVSIGPAEDCPFTPADAVAAAVKQYGDDAAHMPVSFKGYTGGIVTKADTPEDGEADDTQRDGEPETPIQRFARLLAAFFTDQGKQALAALDASKAKARRRAKKDATDDERMAAALNDPRLRAVMDAVSDPKALEPVVTDALRPMVAAGAQAGADALGQTGADLGDFAVSFDVSNPLVERAARERALDLAGDLNQTTLNRLRDSLAEGIAKGESNAQLTQRVREQFQSFTDHRAETVARTESAMAYEQGQQAAWRESGVVESKKWLLAPNACEFCRAVAAQFEKKKVALDGEFLLKGATLRGADGGTMDINYRTIDGPPLHPSCYLPGTPVLARGRVAAYAAIYDGEAVEITLADGRRLAVTGNHQLLTPRGFVAAKSIREGDDVISHRDSIKRFGLGDPHDDLRVAPIEKIVGALAVSPGVTTHAVPVAPEYLHGDGRFCDGNVDVVFADGQLGNALKTPVFKGDHRLPMCADWTSVTLSGLSNFDAMLHGVSLAAHGVVGGAGEVAALGRSELSHANSVGLAPVALLDAPTIQQLDDSPSTVAKLLGESLDRFASEVAVDKIVNVKVFRYAGHVYDLQTETGLTAGNGILTSNCRCDLLPVLSSDFADLAKALKDDDRQAITKFWRGRHAGDAADHRDQPGAGGPAGVPG